MANGRIPKQISQKNQDLRNQLIIAEYNNCRAALLKNIELMDRSEVFYLAGAALSAAYFFSHILKTHCTILKMNNDIALQLANHPVSMLFSLFPLFVLLFGLIRFIILDKTVKIYNNFIEEKELKYSRIPSFELTCL